jgi:hypothetical protein
MPTLSNAKHEIVARALAAGKSQADAYREAGYIYKPANASRLCRRPEISTRVQELVAERAAMEGRAREIGIQRAGLSEEWIIVRLKHVIDLSIRGIPLYDRNGDLTGAYKPNLHAAVAGLRTAAHITGLLVQKHEIGQPGAFAQMTDAELNDTLLAQCKALGLSDRSLQELKISITATQLESATG